MLRINPVRSLTAMAAASMMVLWTAPQADAQTTVEFSEVPVPDFAPLAGTTYFDTFGIRFAGNTVIATDSRIMGAGTDEYGITDNGDIGYSILFLNPASTVTYNAATIDTFRITASAFDTSNNLVGIFTDASDAEANYFTRTFTGIGNIARIDFASSDSLYTAVGRIQFTSVAAAPEPGSLVFIGMGMLPLVSVVIHKRRKA